MKNSILVWNTRLKQHAQALTTALKANNFSVIQQPLLEILPLPIHLPANFDLGIVLSQSIWTANPNWFPSTHTKTPWFAIGASSAKCLLEDGVKNVIYPKEPGSEGLLSLKELQHVAGKTIFLAGGKDKRPLIAETLLARQAKIIEVSFYQRQTLAISETLFKDSTPQFIIAASNEMITALEAMRDRFQWINDAKLVVVSQRGYDYAIDLGFRHVLHANSAYTQDIIHTIKRHT